LLGLAVGDGVIEVVGDGLECCCIRLCGRLCCEFTGECLVLALEGVEACIQGG
jgi:hypothetical protein